MLSQTVEYALRAMSHLAALHGEPATSARIARDTRVPRSYLSKILRALVDARLLQSFRGPNGGFTLARDAKTINILQIVNAVEPLRRIDHCPLDDPAHAELCPLHKCLDDALAQIERSFEHATLATVAGLVAPQRGGATP